MRNIIIAVIFCILTATVDAQVLWAVKGHKKNRPVKYYPVRTSDGSPVIVGVHRLVTAARRDLGVSEDSGRVQAMLGNCGLRGRYRWCAAAVSTWLKESGYNIRPHAGVSDLRAELERKGTVTCVPTVGSVVFFNHSHVGIVAEIVGNKIKTIEGNARNEVRIVNRKLASIREFVVL